MEKKGKRQFNEQIRERTIRMAVEIHQLLADLIGSPVARPNVNQVIRSFSSGTSNYRATSRIRS